MTWITRFATTLSFLKDALDVIFKLSPLSLGASGLLIWSYLHTIGWGGIFSESAMSVAGLAYLFVAAVLLAILLNLMFVLPSMFIMALAQYYDAGQLFPKKAVAASGIALMTWLISFGVIAHIPELSPWWAVAIPFVITGGFGLRNRTELGASSGPTTSTRVTMKALCFSMLAVGAILSTIFTLQVTFSIGSQLGRMDTLSEVLIFIICVLLGGLGTAPGLAYLHKRSVQTDAVPARKAALMALLFVAYVVFGLAITVRPVHLMVLRAAGIYSDVPVTFLISDSKLEPALTAAGLSITHGTGMSTVDAYVRFRFSGVRVLCKTSLAAAAKEAHAQNITPAKAGKVGESAASREAAAAAALGAHCIQMSATELRELRR
ncbi:hypothetical protein CR152_08160 [Massilia violaceinigra]|uniref:Uncharacterized protein n=1 Tax=Massilia violaceinigra TaxID=2045208 RepID=A0A2D2DHM9_9BURK|nr:hypothetical protein [Massilia violaceinigra]ATQ74491.1 hypothetical protein CR152_08160 [Massilia violaceinigra]